jgi:hypothetical protein
MEPGEHTLMRRGAISGATARTRASTAAPTEDSETWPGLCRYISRPAVSEARLSLTPGGLVRYQLKTPYSNGTTHVLFEPLDLIARLATLVPKPRVNLIRYHGVFAPNSAHRAQVTKAHRGKGASDQAAARTDERTPPERRVSPGGDDLGATRRSACSASTSRPARPAAGRCASSPASRTRP